MRLRCGRGCVLTPDALRLRPERMTSNSPAQLSSGTSSTLSSSTANIKQRPSRTPTSLLPAHLRRSSPTIRAPDLPSTAARADSNLLLAERSTRTYRRLYWILLARLTHLAIQRSCSYVQPTMRRTETLKITVVVFHAVAFTVHGAHVHLFETAG